MHIHIHVGVTHFAHFSRKKRSLEHVGSMMYLCLTTALHSSWCRPALFGIMAKQYKASASTAFIAVLVTAAPIMETTTPTDNCALTLGDRSDRLYPHVPLQSLQAPALPKSLLSNALLFLSGARSGPCCLLLRRMRTCVNVHCNGGNAGVYFGMLLCSFEGVVQCIAHNLFFLSWVGGGGEGGGALQAFVLLQRGFKISQEPHVPMASNSGLGRCALGTF